MKLQLIPTHNRAMQIHWSEEEDRIGFKYKFTVAHSLGGVVGEKLKIIL